MTRPATPEEKQVIVRIAAHQGLPAAMAASGYTESTIRAWLKEANVAPARPKRKQRYNSLEVASYAEVHGIHKTIVDLQLPKSSVYADLRKHRKTAAPDTQRVPKVQVNLTAALLDGIHEQISQLNLDNAPQTIAQSKASVLYHLGIIKQHVVENPAPRTTVDGVDYHMEKNPDGTLRLVPADTD